MELAWLREVGRTSGPWTTEGESETVYSLMGASVGNFLQLYEKVQTNWSTLEVLQKKYGVGL
jgi:hypothetical protein